MLAQLKDWCAHKGHEIVAVYRDDESGRRGRAERSGFDRLFTDAHRGRFGLVVFWALDRFSREGTSQTINYLRTLDAYGVRFHSLPQVQAFPTGVGMNRRPGVSALEQKIESQRKMLIDAGIAGAVGMFLSYKAGSSD